MCYTERIFLAVDSGTANRCFHGGHNGLMGKIINEFLPRFTPGGVPVYIADNRKQPAFLDQDYLRIFGITAKDRGGMPNLVVHLASKDWLILIEAVTSHGPVNTRRRRELTSVFARSRGNLVFVTAAPNRKVLSKYLGEIAWGTSVWVADAPDHMIHFNNDRLLGPR